MVVFIIQLKHKGLFQKKSKRGVEDMEFPGVLKTGYVEIPRFN